MMGPAVLVVDDGPQIRATAVPLFQELGCEVFDAYNGQSALKILEARREIQVLLAGVRMPGMSGPELAHVARWLRPDLRVVLTSVSIREHLDCLESVVLPLVAARF